VAWSCRVCRGRQSPSPALPGRGPPPMAQARLGSPVPRTNARRSVTACIDGPSVLRAVDNPRDRAARSSHSRVSGFLRGAWRASTSCRSGCRAAAGGGGRRRDRCAGPHPGGRRRRNFSYPVAGSVCLDGLDDAADRVHPATLRQLLPFYALLCALCGRAPLGPYATGRTRGASRRMVGVALCCYAPTAWPRGGPCRLHRDSDFEHPLIQEPGWRECDLGGCGPPRVVYPDQHNRLPLIRFWSQRPTTSRSNRAVSGHRGHARICLAVNHLRGLYADRLPASCISTASRDRRQQPLTQRLADPVLRGLTTGSFEPLARSKTGTGSAAFNAAVALCGAGEWRELASLRHDAIVPQLLVVWWLDPRLADMPPRAEWSQARLRSGVTQSSPGCRG